MKKSTKKLENYYPDRTYQNHAGSGTIIIKKKAEEEIMHDVIITAKDEIGQCFNHALLSFRKISNGYIVVTRQPETTEIAYNLAKQLQSEMREEINPIFFCSLRHSCSRFLNSNSSFSFFAIVVYYTFL